LAHYLSGVSPLSPDLSHLESAAKRYKLSEAAATALPPAAGNTSTSPPHSSSSGEDRQSPDGEADSDGEGLVIEEKGVGGSSTYAGQLAHRQQPPAKHIKSPGECGGGGVRGGLQETLFYSHQKHINNNISGKIDVFYTVCFFAWLGKANFCKPRTFTVFKINKKRSESYYKKLFASTIIIIFCSVLAL
jgi:hypothetical protein